LATELYHPSPLSLATELYHPSPLSLGSGGRGNVGANLLKNRGRRPSARFLDQGHGASTLTSGPFGDSMSAAARPKPWGVFRQAKGRQFDPTRVELFTLSTRWGALLRVPGVTWEAEGERNDIHKWIASDGSEFVPTNDVENNLFTLPYPARTVFESTFCFQGKRCRRFLANPRGPAPTCFTNQPREC
jgi:hypothetical protein